MEYADGFGFELIAGDDGQAVVARFERDFNGEFFVFSREQAVVDFLGFELETIVRPDISLVIFERFIISDVDEYGGGSIRRRVIAIFEMNIWGFVAELSEHRTLGIALRNGLLKLGFFGEGARIEIFVLPADGGILAVNFIELNIERFVCRRDFDAVLESGVDIGLIWQTFPGIEEFFFLCDFRGDGDVNGLRNMSIVDFVSNRELKENFIGIERAILFDAFDGRFLRAILADVEAEHDEI